MAIDATNLAAFHDVMQQLFNLLNQSYDHATSTDAKTAINDLADAVSAILTELNQEGIAENTAQLQAIQPSVDEVSCKLVAAQAQVNKWVKDIGIAAEIAAVMDKAVQLAAKIPAV